MSNRKLSKEEEKICKNQIEALTNDIEYNKYAIKALTLDIEEGLKWEYNKKLHTAKLQLKQAEANNKLIEVKISTMKEHISKGVKVLDKEKTESE